MSSAALKREIITQIKAAALTALLHASDDIQSTLRDVVRDWRHKVDFDDETTVIEQPNVTRIEVLIRPKGRNVKIFGYVEKGTKRHIINRRLKPYLVFRTGYSARTAPVAKYNQGSGMAFGSIVKTMTVAHPGTKPRKFMETFADELVPDLEARVLSELKQALA